MTRYTTGWAEEAEASLQAQFRHIAIDRKSPRNAIRWLRRVRAAVASLEVMPTRYGVDKLQTAALGVEVHRMVFERTYLIYYTVDDVNQRVTAVIFCHGAQLGNTGP